MILPAGMTILAQAAGPKRIGRLMSVVGAPTLLGPILGPVLGGLILQNLSWRWIFYVNVPIGQWRSCWRRDSCLRRSRVPASGRTSSDWRCCRPNGTVVPHLAARPLNLERYRRSPGRADHPAAGFQALPELDQA